MSTSAPIASPQSVDRILAVLDLLTAAGANGASLAELARDVNAPKSSLISLLVGMTASGHLVKDEAGVYRLGARMFTLAMRIVGSLDLPSLSRPVLERLAAATGETVLLGALAPAGDVAMYIDKMESQSALRYTVPLGEQRDLYCSAIGKLLLAYLPPARQETYLQAHTLRQYTPTTIVSLPELRKELQRIQHQGHAISVGERIVGADAMAAPIFGSGGDLLAALVVAGPSERMRANRAVHLERLKAAAAELSQRMAARAGQQRAA